MNRPRRSRLLNQVSVIALVVASTLAATQALAQNSPNVIVPDGRTLTQTTNLGAVTEVTTGSVSGTHAFNSFSQFNVGAGGTVNLQLPAGASTLFNVVRDAPIQIDGVLNSYRSGQIGGRVFFADPYGMVVGAGGVINTGSLSVSTPTSEFLDRMIAPNGTIDAARVADLEAGNIPISASGSLVIHGRINAQSGVALQGRSVYLGKDQRLFSSAVNTDGLDDGAAVVTEAGDITI
ncbi:MAG: leukotoxin LktA family filamentous adhesin, partial [Phenylobacterium sp.]